MLVFGWTMIALSGLGMLASVICWAVTDRQARRWEAMRQEVREALVYDPINPLVEGFIVFDEEHIAVRHSIVVCEKHRSATRDINKAQIYAWKKGIKTIYYIRLRQMALEGTQVQGCVSCAL